MLLCYLPAEQKSGVVHVGILQILERCTSPADMLVSLNCRSVQTWYHGTNQKFGLVWKVEKFHRMKCWAVCSSPSRPTTMNNGKEEWRWALRRFHVDIRRKKSLLKQFPIPYSPRRCFLWGRGGTAKT